ncbi:MAG: M48 family metalloprotease [Treponema sp.]|jgi:predicted Zn-dependent protease|nr:M48 family metalloprotease [Treponema sp.]
MRKLTFAILLSYIFISAAAVWGQWGAVGGNDPFSAMSNAFNKANPEINLEDDYYLGRTVAANILAQYRPYTANAKLTDYVNRICQAIVINSTNPASYNGYHVMILNTQEYNAFATPGGHIFITKGLVEAANSEDELAALIAHELAHIVLRHAAEIIDGMSLANQLDSIASQAAALAGNSQSAQKVLALRKATSSIVDTMMKNGFSRDQEYAADARALELLNAAGYDPRALISMLQVLQRVQSGQRGGFNSTHPTPADRISRANSSVSKYQVNTTQPNRRTRFFNK